MVVFSVKHKPSLHAALTGSHAGITFGDRDLAYRYAAMIGSAVEEKETCDISSCRIFQAPDYVANVTALLDSWETQLPAVAPAAAASEPAKPKPSK